MTTSTAECKGNYAKRQPIQYSHKAQWQKIVISAIFNHELSKYIKLSKIVPIQVFGFTKDE
jgi:hypothetical protein